MILIRGVHHIRFSGAAGLQLIFGGEQHRQRGGEGRFAAAIYANHAHMQGLGVFLFHVIHPFQLVKLFG